MTALDNRLPCTVAQWLQTATARAGEDALLLALELEQADAVYFPTPSRWAALGPALQRVPPQYVVAPEHAGDPFWAWLDIAALVEFEEAPGLAHLMIQRLLAHTLRAEATEDAVRALHAGLCCARLGRIARTVGHGEDARAWYADAMQWGTRAASPDPTYQGMLGLAVTAVAHGNIPAATRWLRGLVDGTAPAPAAYRLPAHQQLAMLARKRGQLIDALLHCWAAYDLLERPDPREASLRVTMAEIACEAGAYMEAVHAIRDVLTTTSHTRVLAPAYVVALQCLRHSPSTEALWRADGRDPMAEAAALLSGEMAPSDSVALRLALGDSLLAAGKTARAVELWSIALDAARRHHLHERVFGLEQRIETDRHTVAAATADAPADRGARPSARRARAAVAQRHPAVRRLLQL